MYVHLMRVVLPFLGFRFMLQICRNAARVTNCYNIFYNKIIKTKEAARVKFVLKIKIKKIIIFFP